MNTTSRNRALIAVALIIAAVIIALAISLTSTSEDTAGATANEAARIPAGSLQQVSTATVGGDPLPRFDAELAVDPAVGTQAPVITASYFDGTEAVISPADGKPRVLLFLAHWCSHCQAEVKSLTDWFETNSPPSAVEILAISTSVDEGSPNFPPSSWFLREQFPIPVLRDSAQANLASGFGLSGFPYVVVLDGDGNVVSRSSGSMDTTQWESVLDSAAA